MLQTFIALLLIFNACKTHKISQGQGTSELGLENTKWKLVKLDGETIKTPKGAKDIYIYLNNKKLEGFAGCNGIGGEYTINENNLKFTGLLGTKMACPKLNIENKFFQALERTESYSIKENLLSLKTSDDSTLSFEAIKEKK